VAGTTPATARGDRAAGKCGGPDGGGKRWQDAQAGGQALTAGAGHYPAAALLTVYRGRWGIERVFQQITEVFARRRMIGSTPQATVFQAAFCLLLYNMVQVLRGYVAAAQPRLEVAEEVSAEQLFYDVPRELTTVSVLVPPAMVVAAYGEPLSPEALR
jgi:hypothetical protein